MERQVPQTIDTGLFFPKDHIRDTEMKIQGLDLKYQE